MTYGGFKRMTGFCKTKIPAEVSEALEAIKDNDEAVKVGSQFPLLCTMLMSGSHRSRVDLLCSFCSAVWPCYSTTCSSASAACISSADFCVPAGVWHSACDRHVQADFGSGCSWSALVHAQLGAQRNRDFGKPGNHSSREDEVAAMAAASQWQAYRRECAASVLGEPASCIHQANIRLGPGKSIMRLF